MAALLRVHSATVPLLYTRCPGRCCWGQQHDEAGLSPLPAKMRSRMQLEKFWKKSTPKDIGTLMDWKWYLQKIYQVVLGSLGLLVKNGTIHQQLMDLCASANWGSSSPPKLGTAFTAEHKPQRTSIILTLQWHVSWQQKRIINITLLHFFQMRPSCRFGSIDPAKQQYNMSSRQNSICARAH